MGHLAPLTGGLNTGYVDITAADGVQEVIAAVSGKRIIVYAVHLSGAANGAVTFHSASTQISGSYRCGVNATQTIQWPDGTPLFATVAGEALGIKSANTNVGVSVLYFTE